MSLLGRGWRRLTGRPTPPETGEQNARRFVEAVTKEAREHRLVQMWPHEGRRGGRCYDWVWMLNPLWRERVLVLLDAAPVRAAEFSPPDSLDGWTFTAISTVPVPRIAQLGLGDTL